ncbi:hypothetical protein IQ06DRAFT_344933 [Phaeosphaeriaceae sp. SRC1lsM3a]|nr:hypothetical protein IQ06DRAFT_344933 [Stagonospora sp. SRC1lsM3a]
MIDHDTDPTALDPLHGEFIASTLIGIILIVYLLWAIWQAHRGHGSGTFCQRLMQNLFSCCAVEELEDVEKVAEITREGERSRITMRANDEGGDNGKVDSGSEAERKSSSGITL